MNIVLIGTGNVASVLGRKFVAAGHKILQVFGRNGSAASSLAYELASESTTYKSMVNKNADVYIVAVADDAIADVMVEINLQGKVVAHTAAAVPKEVLKKVTNHYGIFYPLQSLRKEMSLIPDIPVFFDGNDELTKTKLEALAHSISNEKVTAVSEDDLLKLHVAAVIVSNFTNHLYVLAEDYCRKEGLDFKTLLPLIEETALRLRSTSPKLAQTGPAIRHDKETIEKHLELLKNHPQLKSLYVLLTESIQQIK